MRDSPLGTAHRFTKPSARVRSVDEAEMPLYSAFGLTIASSIPLPSLAAGHGDPDLVVRLGSAGRPMPPSGGEQICDVDETGVYLAWPGSVAVRIGPDRAIYAECADGTDPGILPLPLLGPVIAVVLHQRGLLVLHGSTVSVNGRPAVLLGDKGAGKSTTAAAFAAAGHALLSDDVTAVDTTGSTAAILPGFPQLKLSEDARSHFLSDLGHLMPPPVGGFPKQLVKVESAERRLHRNPLFFILSRGESAGVTPLAGRDAFMALVRYSYIPRLPGPLMKGPHGARHAMQCAALTAAASVFSLKVPAGFDRIGEAVSVVERLTGSEGGGHPSADETRQR